MKSIEDIIENKLFPALFQADSGSESFYSKADISYCYENAVKKINGNSSVGKELKSELYVPIDKKENFIRNVFNLDKIVQKIGLDDYLLAREVVKQFIFQEELNGGRFQKRLYDFLILSSVESNKSVLIDDDKNLENALFFCNALYGDVDLDVKITGDKIISFGTNKDVGAWYFYNVLKTGNSDEAMKKMKVQIIKDCSRQPQKIREYLVAYNNSTIGVLGHKNDLSYYYQKTYLKKLEDNELNQLMPILLISKVAEKYKEMMFLLLEENNMSVSLDEKQKEIFSISLLSAFEKEKEKLDLSNVVAKMKAMGIDLEKQYTPNVVNYVFENFKIDQQSGVNLLNTIKDKKNFEFEKVFSGVSLNKNIDFMMLFLQEAYQKNEINKEKNGLTMTASNVFFEQLKLNLDGKFFLNNDKTKKEELITSQLKNLPNWIDKNNQVKILIDSVLNNDSVNSSIREYFNENYNEDYKKLLYSFQNFRESVNLENLKKNDDCFVCDWRGESQSIKIDVKKLFSSGIKDEEINKLRFNEIINNSTNKCKLDVSDLSGNFKL